MNNYDEKRLVDAVVEIAMALAKLASETKRANDISDGLIKYIDDREVCMEKVETGHCGWTLPCTRHPKGK